MKIDFTFILRKETDDLSKIEVAKERQFCEFTSKHIRDMAEAHPCDEHKTEASIYIQIECSNNTFHCEIIQACCPEFLENVKDSDPQDFPPRTA